MNGTERTGARPLRADARETRAYSGGPGQFQPEDCELQRFSERLKQNVACCDRHSNLQQIWRDVSQAQETNLNIRDRDIILTRTLTGAKNLLAFTLPRKRLGDKIKDLFILFVFQFSNACRQRILGPFMFTWRRRSQHAAKATSFGFFRRIRKNEDGATAIEFAMVAMPFLGLLFGIIAVGLFFFTTFSLENAVEQAARLIRTGQAQQTGMTSAQFKTRVCEFVPSHFDCVGKIFVNVKNFANSTDIQPADIPTCLDNSGNLKQSADYVPGGASTIVLVWACYEWDMAKFPWINLGNMANGSRLIQASTTFRTEPYSN